MPRTCWIVSGVILWGLVACATAEPVTAQDTSYEGQIVQACAVHGCDPGWLIGVMYCESGGNHSAIGPNGERGLFQYHPYGMWPEMAWAGPSEQIWHAAQMFAAGLSYHWACA